MEVAALKSSPLLATIDPPPAIRHNESLLRWPERSILDATPDVVLKNGQGVKVDSTA